MGILTEDMKRVVREQKLGFVATVCPDGTPNLSPKGTTAVWDDDHLVFANLRSPQTMENLRHNPAIEINVVDVIARKGYRFKGRATIVADGPLHDQLCQTAHGRGVDRFIKEFVLIKIERAGELVSPAYDTGQTEDQVRSDWLQYWIELNRPRLGAIVAKAAGDG
ncbi:MAG TPA: pyridoxamine 5'-phosphate oxidase family protein [Dehalococcoidia bacterium]|nr:pyridoxamine 5'-phosphate oxidase family protein [Dehalococcoidia bacterium]